MVPENFNDQNVDQHKTRFRLFKTDGNEDLMKGQMIIKYDSQICHLIMNLDHEKIRQEFKWKC